VHGAFHAHDFEVRFAGAHPMDLPGVGRVIFVV
jgi:hypothetical protein